MIEIIKYCDFDTLSDELRGTKVFDILETIRKNEKTVEFMQILESTSEDKPIHIIELEDGLEELKKWLYEELNIIEED